MALSRETQWLVLTTLPHLMSCLLAPDSSYATIVFQSTALSVLWHMSQLPADSFLGYLDHVWALVWMFMDLWYANTPFQQNSVLIWNYYSYLLHQVAEDLSKKNALPYYIGHSLWHCFSVLKSAYLTHLLSKAV